MWDSFGCSNDSCTCDLISGTLLCAGPSALIAYCPTVQPANSNSLFIDHLKGNFREVFYSRDFYSSPPLSTSPLPTVIGPLILTRNMAGQNKDDTFLPPLQLGVVTWLFPEGEHCVALSRNFPKERACVPFSSVFFFPQLNRIDYKRPSYERRRLLSKLRQLSRQEVDTMFQGGRDRVSEKQLDGRKRF